MLESCILSSFVSEANWINANSLRPFKSNRLRNKNENFIYAGIDVLLSSIFCWCLEVEASFESAGILTSAMIYLDGTTECDTKKRLACNVVLVLSLNLL